VTAGRRRTRPSRRHLGPGRAYECSSPRMRLTRLSPRALRTRRSMVSGPARALRCAARACRAVARAQRAWRRARTLRGARRAVSRGTAWRGVGVPPGSVPRPLPGALSVLPALYAERLPVGRWRRWSGPLQGPALSACRTGPGARGDAPVARIGRAGGRAAALCARAAGPVSRRLVDRNRSSLAHTTTFGLKPGTAPPLASTHSPWPCVMKKLPVSMRPRALSGAAASYPPPG